MEYLHHSFFSDCNMPSELTKIGPKVKLIKNTRRKSTSLMLQVCIYMFLPEKCARCILLSAKPRCCMPTKTRNILKRRIKESSLLRTIYAWWWFQGEQPGHSAWVLGSVIDAGCPQCPPVTHIICASFAHINVIAFPHKHFSCCFIPKSSLVLKFLQQFAFPWAVGTQSRPKAYICSSMAACCQGFLPFWIQQSKQLPFLILTLVSALQKYFRFMGCKFNVACIENNIYVWFNWAVHEVWIILKQWL